jgi:hypothetical protein
MVEISFTSISIVLEMIKTALLYLKDLFIVKYSKDSLLKLGTWCPCSQLRLMKSCFAINWSQTQPQQPIDNNNHLQLPK